jgi:hypothetical protein
MSTLFFDRTPTDDFPSLLSHYELDEFASPWRSTLPLIALARDATSMFSEILDRCQMATDSDFHFEFQVKPPLGHGKSSHTDLMVRSEDRCLAIEAKWTEPMYDTVSVWMARDKPSRQRLSNREEVLAGWLKLLRVHANRELAVGDFSKCIYQMVHRAASACWEMKYPQLAYLRFVEATEGDIRKSDAYCQALQALHSLLGSPRGFPFYFVEVCLAQTAAFKSIGKLPKGSRGTANRVLARIRDFKLFEFEAYRVQSIGAENQR